VTDGTACEDCSYMLVFIKVNNELRLKREMDLEASFIIIGTVRGHSVSV
jgi:hypothetical protein